MEEIKKYRVICNTQKEFNELKSIYKKSIVSNFNNNLNTYYYCTWFNGYRKLSMWGAGSIDCPEIIPITFKEWKEDYYKSKEISYEIY